MAEFVDYKVVLHLKDGTQTSGFVSHVDSKQITLGSKTIENLQVRDLKVVQLPTDNKQKRKGVPSSQQSDDVMVAAPGNTSKTASQTSTPQMQKNNPDWGSDVSKIKASTDFDFAANLAMFDKKSVFAHFQKNDQVSASDRLVGHNKVEKTKPKKTAQDKYHNDEMVLESSKQDSWHSIGSLSQRLSSPVNAGAVAHANGGANRESQALKMVFSSTLEDVPLASPVQLLEIERVAQEVCGVDGRTSVEISASNLYNLVVNKILGGSVRLSNRKNHNLPPLVLLLIGSTHCSTRAFALGRHLSNHGVRVLAYVINEDIVDADMLHQCQLFEKCGGKVVSTDFAQLLDLLNNQLETPVELVVDALQGLANQLPDIFYTAKSMATLKQVVRWTNESRQKFKVLSLDIASGIDGGSGTVADPGLQVNSKYIVSLGFPISGLLHAYNHGSLVDDIEHYVVDVGIPNTVFSAKPHLRKFDKFWYCAEGYMKLETAGE